MAMTINEAADTVTATQFADDTSPADKRPADTQAARRRLQRQLDELDAQGLAFLDDMQRTMWKTATDLNMCEVADQFMRGQGLKARPKPVAHAVDFTVTLHGRYIAHGIDTDDVRDTVGHETLHGVLEGVCNNYRSLHIDTLAIDNIVKHNEAMPIEANYDLLVGKFLEGN